MSLDKLNSALFDQLDRLNNAEGEKLDTEIERSKAMTGIAKNITESARTQLSAIALAKEWSIKPQELPEALCVTQKK
jgi:hypothetical protein